MRDRTEDQMKSLPCALPENVSLVFIRHGATKANRERRYLGKTEESLCGEGRAALLESKKQNIYPEADYLFSSPMKRCLETASILYPALCPVVIPEWREMDFGLFEYHNPEELKGDARYQAWLDSNGLLPFPEGESREDFVLRCEDGFIKMCGKLCREAEHKKKKAVTAGLIVHGGTIMALLSRYGKKGYFDYQVSSGNGYRCRVKQTDGGIRMEEPEILRAAGGGQI